MTEITIQKSNKPDKKFKATVVSGNDKKTIHFGQAGASDYTKHKDKERKERYIDRHKKNEKWGLDGVKTAGFYSKHILWNKPTLKGSVDDLNKRFKSLNVKIT